MGKFLAADELRLTVNRHKLNVTATDRSWPLVAFQAMPVLYKDVP